ncbi:hypothetical protein SAY86_024481 [Trapa natans]|uniref:Uncharacterized protein n=1 Tax=Trapa natans TaxID=22666 RepID=A0AAN7MQ01_TRANT|nr:hypothetical protein SAY86_024481 [Trapa natans]
MRKTNPEEKKSGEQEDNSGYNRPRLIAKLYENKRPSGSTSNKDAGEVTV